MGAERQPTIVMSHLLEDIRFELYLRAQVETRKLSSVKIDRYLDSDMECGDLS
jgi:hypothetical protein